MSDCTVNGACDDIDIAIIRQTQSGLPLCREPYKTIAEKLGISDKTVMERLERMLDQGVIRRIAAVPNHYALGFTANGMAVWDVRDDYVDKAGMIIGALDFVSHCYRRPRHLPEWPYNLFAMVHGKSRESTGQKAAMITELLGDKSRSGTVLYSKRILKKTGLRI